MFKTGDRLELLWPGDEEPSEWRVSRVGRTLYWRSDVPVRYTITVQRPAPPWTWASDGEVQMTVRSWCKKRCSTTWWAWTDPFPHTTPVDRRPPVVVRRLPCPTPK